MTSLTTPLRPRPPTVVGPPPVRSQPRRLATVAAATGAAWTAIVAARLFVGGTVGMGDQGDARRLLCQLGVRSTTPFNESTSAFVHPTWVAHQWYGEACSADGAGGVFRSSQLWLLSMAKHLTAPLGLPGALDLRAQGVLCAFLVGLVVAALVVVLPGRLALRVTIASLVGLLAADSMVAQFFISPYSEPLELLGALALCPALLAMWRRGHTTWPSLAAVGFLATVVIGAKTQAAALLPALVVAVLWLPHHRPRRRRDASVPSDWPRLRARLQWSAARLPGLALCALLFGVTAYFVGTGPVGLTQQDVYAEVFGQILRHSDDPAADLRSLGADPKLADAAGTNPESAKAATLRPEYLKFREDVTHADIVKFYVTHPLRLIPTAGDGLTGVAHWRQDYLGSYLPDSGERPGAIENRIGVYGGIFRNAWQPLLVIFWLATLYVGFSTARHRSLGSEEQALGRLAVFVALGSFFEFWAVMISVGYPDLYKHMVLTNVLLALGLPVMIACCWVRLRHWRARPRTSEGTTVVSA